ncbi:MAG: hypothetical protein KKD18_05035 [Nanoarchaeota archaeon]|nr:hypothetical protein [Nanoarchaeota archaeon]MBU0977755.1 hypothetical protein [Nanoarchaeota archaeon]
MTNETQTNGRETPEWVNRLPSKGWIVGRGPLNDKYALTTDLPARLGTGRQYGSGTETVISIEIPGGGYFEGRTLSYGDEAETKLRGEIARTYHALKTLETNRTHLQQRLFSKLSEVIEETERRQD